MTRNTVFAGLIGFALLAGCNDKSNDARKLQDEMKEGELEGSVFIVTKSRENIKMGLVTVSLFEADRAKQSLRKVREELLARAHEIAVQSTPLLVVVTNLYAEYEASKAEYHTMERSLQRALVTSKSNLTNTQSIMAVLRLQGISGSADGRLAIINGRTFAVGEAANLANFEIPGGSIGVRIVRMDDQSVTVTAEGDPTPIELYLPGHPKVKAAGEALKAAGLKANLRMVELNKAIDAYNLATQPQRDLISNYQTLCMSALDPVISSAKTDADGKFKLPVPKSGEFVLTATASREIGGDTESYSWMVIHSLGGKDRGQILLSNDNQVDAYQPPSIVERLDYAPIEKLEHEWKAYFESSE